MTFGVAGSNVRHQLGNHSTQDLVFIDLLVAYRPHGGISRLLSLAGSGRIQSEGQGSDIEDVVDAGKLFGFRWHHDFWLPMFQFDMPRMTVATGPQRAVAELGRSFDGWALASWFVQPNNCLAGRSPIECLSSNLPDVLEAAREDRFVASG
jgi:hypothetical protein